MPRRRSTCCGGRRTCAPTTPSTAPSWAWAWPPRAAMTRRWRRWMPRSNSGDCRGSALRPIQHSVFSIQHFPSGSGLPIHHSIFSIQHLPSPHFPLPGRKRFFAALRMTAIAVGCRRMQTSGSGLPIHHSIFSIQNFPSGSGLPIQHSIFSIQHFPSGSGLPIHHSIFSIQHFPSPSPITTAAWSSTGWAGPTKRWGRGNAPSSCAPATTTP